MRRERPPERGQGIESNVPVAKQVDYLSRFFCGVQEQDEKALTQD